MRYIFHASDHLSVAFRSLLHDVYLKNSSKILVTKKTFFSQAKKTITFLETL